MLTHTLTVLSLLPLVASMGNVQEDLGGLGPIQILTRVPTAQPTAKVAVPTYQPDTSMFPVTFADYSEKTCGSTPTISTCYVDPKGNAFRFGCKKQDGGKVYTDTCHKGRCVECDNNWKWMGDEANQCSQSMDQFFQFQCSAPEIEKPKAQVPVQSFVAAKSCEQLGWSTAGGSDSVCAESAVINGRCSGEVDATTASNTCAKVGARLCTSDELALDEAKSSGCKFDCARVWSSSQCTTKEGASGFMSMSGAKKCASSVPSRCDDAKAQTGVVRCCSDVSTAPVVGARFGYPAGYSPAISSDYPSSDGACGKSKALKSYSCWTNPVDGTSQRFACRPNSQIVWTQNCGQDDTCGQCSGDWFSQDELLGKCYSADSLLYSYACSK